MKKTKSIDEKIKDLDKITEMFEKGDLGIEESISKVKDADLLIKSIMNDLNNIQLEIEEILLD